MGHLTTSCNELRRQACSILQPLHLHLIHHPVSGIGTEGEGAGRNCGPSWIEAEGDHGARPLIERYVVECRFNVDVRAFEPDADLQFVLIRVVNLLSVQRAGHGRAGVAIDLCQAGKVTFFRKTVETEDDLAIGHGERDGEHILWSQLPQLHPYLIACPSEGARQRND